MNTTVSSYLVNPYRRTGRHIRQSVGGLIRLRYYRLRIISRTVVALLIWSAVIGSIKFAANPQAPSARQFAGLQASLAHGAGLTSPATALSAAVAAAALPDGPSGQLLPPGAMAPDRTYRNSYAWGQCTWYVAGRRQIPANWGNARNWYYRAQAEGWSVGTSPALAAVAWTPSGYFGHVALVEDISADGSQIYLSEMNYLGIGRKSYRWAAAESFKYIY